MCLVHQYFWYYGNWISLNCYYFLFLLLGTHLLYGFPCSLPITSCMTASNMESPSVQLPLPSFLKFVKCISHPCREDLSISIQGLEEVKYSGKCSSFPSSCQICCIALLVLLQDAFPEENCPVSVAERANCSLWDEETKGGQNRIQAETSLAGPSPAVPEPGKHSREWSNKNYW